MIVTNFGIFVIAFIITILLCWLIFKTVKIKADNKYAIGCFGIPFGILVIYCLIGLFTPTIIIITDNESNIILTDGKSAPKHEKKMAWFSYKGNTIDFNSCYIDNQTDIKLINFPMYYGDSDIDPKFINDLQVIEPKSFVKATEEPKHFFYIPKTIFSKTKESSICEWSLVTLDDVEQFINQCYKL